MKNCKIIDILIEFMVHFLFNLVDFPFNSAIGLQVFLDASIKSKGAADLFYAPSRQLLHFPVTLPYFLSFGNTT